MPTGYTSSVQKGEITELKDYILDCSRSFGALIHMRDDNSGQIKYREVSDYHMEQLDRSRRDYEDFSKLSDEDIQNIIDESYNRRVKEQEEGLKNFEEGKQRYLDMLEKVKSWTPPTDEHINLRKFAIEQLEKSLEFDYSDNLKKYYLQEPFKDTVESYKQCKLKMYLDNIERHSKGYKEELEGVEKANKWIDDLINSFK